MTEQEPRTYRRSVYALMLLAIVIRLVYFLYTHRTWEDALITVQHSEDFVRGMGLTHPVPAGEGPLHGFTSPLSVLIPLLGDLMHAGFGVTFLKLVSLGAAALSVLFGTRIARLMGLPHALALTVGAFLTLEHHQILWGMAGMETQVVTLCYLWLIYSALQAGPWVVGIVCGVAMLARPDAAFLVAIAFCAFAWRTRETRDWKALGIVVTALVLVYGPWIAFTTIYYGSPVPNTILAKAAGYPTVIAMMHGMGRLGIFEYLVLGRFAMVYKSLGPSYGGNGAGVKGLVDPGFISGIMLLLVLLGAVTSVLRRNLAAMVVCAFVLLYGAYLALAANVIFGWYTVPVVAGAVLAACYGLWALLERLPSVALRHRSTLIFGVLYITIFAVMLPFTFRSDKYLQEHIETGVRKSVGLWLGSVSAPTDTIGSESLGYVGYYSGRVIYDYPGLCSRPVVRYLQSHPQGRNMAAMMQTLQPTYLVLRPREYKNHPQYSWLAEDYTLVRVFKATPDAAQHIIHGDENIDTEFDIFRRNDAAHSATPAAS